MILDYRGWFFFEGVGKNVFFLCSKSIFFSVGEIFGGVLEVLEFFSMIKSVEHTSIFEVLFPGC